MVEGWRLYWTLAGASMRCQMAYRASFAIQAVTQAAICGIEFAAIWALFDRFGALPGWTLAEVAVLYGLVGAGFAIADAVCVGFDHTGMLIKQGTLDTMLLRPRSVPLQLLGYELTLRRIGRLLQAAVVGVWGWVTAGVALGPTTALLALGVVAGSACLFLALFVLQGFLAFYTTESLEVANTLTYGGLECAQYPMTVYPAAFRRFFTVVVPTACVSYFPTVALLGKTDPLGSPVAFQVVAPLLGPAFLACMLALFGVGLRRYASTGS